MFRPHPLLLDPSVYPRLALRILLFLRLSILDLQLFLPKPFPCLTSIPQTAEKTATLSPFPVALTTRVKPKSFVCHSYKKYRGRGTSRESSPIPSHVFHMLLSGPTQHLPQLHSFHGFTSHFSGYLGGGVEQPILAVLYRLSRPANQPPALPRNRPIFLRRQNEHTHLRAGRRYVGLHWRREILRWVNRQPEKTQVCARRRPYLR